jgi:hypothetical protein
MGATRGAIFVATVFVELPVLVFVMQVKRRLPKAVCNPAGTVDVEIF